MDQRPTPQAGPPSTPKWVWIAGSVAAALLLVVLVIHFMGGGLGGH